MRINLNTTEPKDNKKEIISHFENELLIMLENIKEVKDKDERLDKLTTLFKIYKYFKYFDELEPHIDPVVRELERKNKMDRLLDEKE